MTINNRYEITEKDGGMQVRNIRGSWFGMFDTFGQAFAFVVTRLAQRSEVAA